MFPYTLLVVLTGTPCTDLHPANWAMACCLTTQVSQWAPTQRGLRTVADTQLSGRPRHEATRTQAAGDLSTRTVTTRDVIVNKTAAPVESSMYIN